MIGRDPNHVRREKRVSEAEIRQIELAIKRLSGEINRHKKLVDFLTGTRCEVANIGR